MGKAIVIPNVNFSAKNLGLVTPSQNIPLESLEIISPSAIVAKNAQLQVNYVPENTTERGILWSVESGNEYAAINQSTGALTILEGASGNSIVVKVVSTDNTSIYATKNITVTYPTLWEEALEDADISPYMLGKSKLYENQSEIVKDGTATGTAITQPITSLTQNFFVLFDVTFVQQPISVLAPALFCRLADNAALATYNDSHVGVWYTDMKYPAVKPVGELYGTRTKMFIAFNKSNNRMFVKNLTTGEKKTYDNITGGGTLRDEFYLGGGASEDNNFAGTIHKFYVGG